MKRFSYIFSILLAVILAFSLTSCDKQKINACKTALDALGFQGMPAEDDFFKLSERFSCDGATMAELLIYDFNTSNGRGKTNSNDTLTMKHETITEADGKYAKTYQYFMTYKALDGLTLPEDLTVGDSLADALEKLVGNKNAAKNFEGNGEFEYEMILAQKDGATIAYRDTTKDKKGEVHRFIYQIRYTDTTRQMTENGSVLTKRTLILSFDNTAEGHPLKMIEISLESRYKV